MVNIIEITATQSLGYKDFFTKGLIKHSDCFRISPLDEQQEPFPTKGTSDSFTLAAVNEANQLMGVVSFKKEYQNREKLSHKGLLFRMYVASEYGGRGIGKLLLENLIQRVRLLKDIEQINLTVVASNPKAKNLYQQIGFMVYGLEKNSVKSADGIYYDEELMSLSLNS